MRITVCPRFQDQIRRLLWLSESKNGFYFGIYNGFVDSHASYHQDGTRHWRTAKSYHQRWKDSPLAEFSGYKQLAHSVIPPNYLTSDWLVPHILPSRNELVQVFDHELFGLNSSIALDFWLSDEESQSRLLAATGHIMKRRTAYRIVSELSSGLDFFPNLKFTLLVWSALVTEPLEQLGVEA